MLNNIKNVITLISSSANNIKQIKETLFQKEFQNDLQMKNNQNFIQ